MVELGLPNLLRTIITIALIYYGVKFLFRWWLKRKVSAAVKQQQNTMSEHEASYKRQEKGRVNVKQEKSSDSTQSSGGEYVDFEEVE